VAKTLGTNWQVSSILQQNKDSIVYGHSFTYCLGREQTCGFILRKGQRVL